MIENITVIQWISLVFIALPIAVLVVNNRLLSAKKESSQLWLLATLGCALIAAESSNAFFLAASIFCFVIYTIALVQYYVAAMNCAKRHERLPSCKRP